jgi:hypothetical protein
MFFLQFFYNILSPNALLFYARNSEHFLNTILTEKRFPISVNVTFMDVDDELSCILYPFTFITFHVSRSTLKLDTCLRLWLILHNLSCGKVPCYSIPETGKRDKLCFTFDCIATRILSHKRCASTMGAFVVGVGDHRKWIKLIPCCFLSLVLRPSLACAWGVSFPNLITSAIGQSEIQDHANTMSFPCLAWSRSLSLFWWWQPSKVLLKTRCEKV